ncbi:MAG: TIGR00289 family protein [Hadesarchaea archaeon]|nr:MAG: TIGR00289 family protein [Hadesarchaea archaeon]
MKIVSLLSGGKDSMHALWLAEKEGHTVENVLVMVPNREDSWMYHRPNVKLIDLLSKCIGFPFIKVETSGIREEELNDLKRVLEKLEVDGVVSGAIASVYQKSRIDRICNELGLKSITPLWGRNPLELLREFLAAGFEAIVTKVSAEGLDENWLGRKLDSQAMRDLLELNRRYGVHISGEGGEYESLVLNGPIFKKRIELLEVKRLWHGTSGHLIIKQAKLAER